MEDKVDRESIEKDAGHPEFSRSYFSLPKLLKKPYTGSAGSGKRLVPTQDGPLYIQGEMPHVTQGAISWKERFKKARERNGLRGKENESM